MDKNASKKPASWDNLPNEVKDKEVFALSDDMADEEVKACIAALAQGRPLNEDSIK